MEREIIFLKNVELYLNELMLLLFEEGYFGFPDSVKSYVDLLISFAEQHVGIDFGRNAPDFFKRFGQNLKYITYHANKKTSWYIFYQERNNIYLIRHITNNHIAAQYF